MKTTVRSAAAARLRALADRLSPRADGPPRLSPSPLVRLGGRWMYRGELVVPAAGGEEAAPDVQLRP